MRKSLALALALVFAFASVSLAATPSISGEFTATATHKDKEKFFGPYTNSASLSLSVSFASEEDNWDASFALTGLDKLDKVTLGRYIVNVKEDAFKFTAWGKYGTGNIGTLGDALGFVPVSGQNDNDEPKFRLTTNLGGVDAAVQVEHKGAIYLNGKMGFDQFTLGATVAHRTASPKNYNDFAVYGGADLGIVNVNAAFASTGEADKDNTAMGIKASSDITEQLSVEATYVTSGKAWAADDDRFSLGATFTEGLFQAGASYTQNQDQKTSGYKVSVVYRGSEDNVAFGDLFEEDQYYNNVAPAFGLTYKVDTPDEEKATTTITVQGTAPVVADQLWVFGSIEAKSKEGGFKIGEGFKIGDEPADNATAASSTTVKLQGYAPVGKLKFIPSITSTSYSKVKVVGGASEGGGNGTPVEGGDGSNDSGAEDEDASNSDNGNGGNGNGAREGGYSTLKVALDVEYEVAADVTLFFGIGQSTKSGTGDFAGDYDPVRYTEFGVKVSF